MLDILKELSQARLDTLFVLFGLAFLAVAVLGNISDKIQPGKEGRIVSGVLGPVLIIVGLWMHGGHTAADEGADKAQSISSPTTIGGRPDGTQPTTLGTETPTVTPLPAKAPTGSPTDTSAHNTSPNPVPLNEFSGSWKNVDPQARGLTTIQIRVAGNKAWVHAWGSCSPRDCDWGEVEATAFAPDVSSHAVRSVAAVYTTGFSQTHLTLHAGTSETLEVESATHFTDKSGRSDYSAKDSFQLER